MSDTVPEIDGYGELVEIGSGGFSRVYKARQFEFERPVAIKVLSKSLKDDAGVAAFEQECRTMGALWDHPNIVTVFASAFTSDGRPCIVMRLFEEGNYYQLLRRNGSVPVDQLLIVGVKIAGALAAAHDAGVIHGDVKPHNIFKSKFGEPALGDFGIATFVGQHETNELKGLSVHYAAPELVEGEPGPKADQYSLAATLFTLAVGKRPFELPDGPGSDSNTQVLLRVLEAPTPELPEAFPEQLRDVIRRAMDRDPDLRYDSLGEFGTALSEVEQGLKLPRTHFPAHSLPTDERSKDSLKHDGQDRANKQGVLPDGADESTTGGQPGRKRASSKTWRRQWHRRGETASQRDQHPASAEESPHEDRADAIVEPTPSTPERSTDGSPQAAKPSDAPPAGRTVKARVCVPCGHAHPVSVAACHRCGTVLNKRTSQIRSLSQPELGTVRLSGGQVESLDQDLVIGRHPTAEPLEPHQRAVTIGEGDRTISRRHIELRLNGWDLTAKGLGRNTRLEHRGTISRVDPGAVVDLMLGDTLYFGTDSWLRYTSRYDTPDQKSPIVAHDDQPTREEQIVDGASEHTQFDPSTGEFAADSASSPALPQSQLGGIELSGGGNEVLDADLIIGRNPALQPLEPHQRAVTHGGDDRTISRRHLELKRTSHHPTATCLGNMIGLERDGVVSELLKGAVHQLQPGDILHYGTDTWLRYIHEADEGSSQVGESS